MTYTPVELRHVTDRPRPARLQPRRWSSRSSTRSPTASRPPGASAESSPTRSTRSRRRSDELKGREELLANTLVAAEQAASGLREQARARGRGDPRRGALRGPLDRPHRRRASASGCSPRRGEIEALLRAALGIVHDEHAGAPAALAPAPVEPVEPAAPPETVPRGVAGDEGGRACTGSRGGGEDRRHRRAGRVEEVPEARRQATREFDCRSRLPPVEIDEPAASTCSEPRDRAVRRRRVAQLRLGRLTATGRLLVGGIERSPRVALEPRPGRRQTAGMQESIRPGRRREAAL